MKSCLLPDGRRFAYRETGSGRPLVLLHGWSMSSAVFSEIMPRLASTHRVLVPDLTGHGATQFDGTRFDLDSLAADIEAWLAQLEVGRIELLGWSLGGQVALRMTRRREVRVDKLILVATTPLFVATDDWEHGLPATQVRAMDRQLTRNYEKTMGDFFRLMFADEALSRDRYRDIIRFAVRAGGLPQVEIARAGLRVLGRTDLRPELDAVRQPVLVHYGSRDVITLPAAGSYLAHRLRSDRVACWDDVGHAPFLSRPVASAVLWQEFLQ